MINSTIPDLTLQYDQPLGLLRVEWISGDDLRTFRQSAGQLLAFLAEHEVRHLLLNMNTFPDISVYDQVWLGLHWMPDLVKMPLERVVLAIGRRRVHNQLAIDSLIALFRSFIKFDIQFFPTALPGLHWLSDYSVRMDDLLAEWDAVHGPGPAPGDVSLPRPVYTL